MTKYLSLFVLGIIVSIPVRADSFNYDYSSDLQANDYLFGSYGKKKDPVFDNERVIDLDIKLGIGSDCGQISFQNTLRSSLSNIFDKKYLEGMFNNILGASPMLATCYMSPTWCAILKNAQVQAHMIANMRLDQCSLIDKYVDSRVEDYYQERQTCMRKAMKNNGNNAEAALDQCKNYWDTDLASWTGGSKKNENRLISDSAEWAGFSGAEANRVLDLVKGLIGDTVVTKGNVSVDFGPRRVQLTPRTHLMALERATFDDLCGKVVPKVQRSGRNANVDRVITNDDLRRLSGESKDLLVDRQTIRSLSFMPYGTRQKACQKLADAIAMSVFSKEMSQSLDTLTKLAQNPNLPDQRKQELDRKRYALKDQIEMTVTLKQQTNDPLNQVLSQINEEGAQYEDLAISRQLQQNEATHQSQRNEAIYMDCADGLLCVH
ncbi:MAG: hypothetical protein AB7F43_06945 [Bacteriovoracia bacterium]